MDVKLGTIEAPSPLGARASCPPPASHFCGLEARTPERGLAHVVRE